MDSTTQNNCLKKKEKIVKNQNYLKKKKGGLGFNPRPDISNYFKDKNIVFFAPYTSNPDKKLRLQYLS